MGAASGVTIAIASAVPLAAPERRDEALRWGDDYQLLFTACHPALPAIASDRRGGRGEAPSCSMAQSRSGRLAISTNIAQVGPIRDTSNAFFANLRSPIPIIASRHA
jgi:hypothetical protein